jgi:GNAT superfamily N-acetyltransferase
LRAAWYRPGTMPLAYLRDRPDLFPVVAGWIWGEWSHLLAQRSLPEFEAWLRRGGRGPGLPTTLVQIDNAGPIATVSLECDDMDLRPDLTPWLASLYVLPASRGRGLGRALVRAAEEQARALGVTELFLYTPAQEKFYAALGWERLEQCVYRAAPVTIMRRQLKPA